MQNSSVTQGRLQSIWGDRLGVYFVGPGHRFKANLEARPQRNPRTGWWGMGGLEPSRGRLLASRGALHVRSVVRPGASWGVAGASRDAPGRPGTPRDAPGRPRDAPGRPRDAPGRSGTHHGSYMQDAKRRPRNGSRPPIPHHPVLGFRCGRASKFALNRSPGPTKYTPNRSPHMLWSLPCVTLEFCIPLRTSFKIIPQAARRNF